MLLINQIIMKTILLFTSLLIASLHCFSQKINKIEVDKFTKEIVVETKGSFLIKKNGFANIKIGLEMYIQANGGALNMPAAIYLPTSFKFDENSGLMFLLDNDETISLPSAYTGIATPGQGFAPASFSTCFPITKENAEKLMDHDIISVRIKYMGGHEDVDLSRDKQDFIRKSIYLVIDAIRNKK